MQQILDSTSEWAGSKALAQRAMLILALLLGLDAAQADSTTNFTGDFAAAFWTNSPVGLGSVYFTNSSTELVLTGPNQPPGPTTTTSVDPITYNGPLEGGLAVGGTVQFHWAYDSGDAVSTSQADFAWTPPGGESSVANVLAQSGGGAVQSGDFLTPLLLAGTTFQFLLTTETPPGKPSGTLIITDFQFHPDIPEPSTGTLLATVLVCLGATRWRRSRRQASSQP